VVRILCSGLLLLVVFLIIETVIAFPSIPAGIVLNMAN